MAILFISNMFRIPWGGSEELWTRTARLLVTQGVSVAASVQGWPKLDRRIFELSRIGVDLRLRPIKSSIISLGLRYISGKAQIVYDIERSFGGASPAIVAISNAYGTPPIEIAEMCIAKGWPFVILTHSSLPDWWPPSEVAARARKALASARRCFFVSENNRVLLEKQVGHYFDNAEVVRNPLVLKIDSAIRWPELGPELRMACVARLSHEKGQDIVLEALATSDWRARQWRLTFYGEGPTRDVLERLVERLKLRDRVLFAGHVEPEQIWRENDILVLPSRCEGMPLTLVEAMFCGRPVVATNVGGVSELVQNGVTGFIAAAAVVECFREALERMWLQRARLQGYGEMAAASVRKFLPDDPVRVFAEKLLALTSLAR
jgi:glycosyltransferase involved in cell wall biosynthesis